MTLWWATQRCVAVLGAMQTTGQKKSMSQTAKMWRFTPLFNEAS
jgi:hypothetical protein